MLGAVAVVGWACDQYTKHLALTHLSEGRSVPFLGEVLQFRLIFNPGAAFSLGEGATWLFTILALIVFGVIVGYLLPNVRSMPWAVAFGLLGAGVAGNLTDRLVRAPGVGRGHVVDFLQLPKWPIFNVADMCIVAAAVSIIAFSLWVTTTWRGEPTRSEPTDTSDDVGAEDTR